MSFGKNSEVHSPFDSTVNTPYSARTPCTTFENESPSVTIYDLSKEWTIGKNHNNNNNYYYYYYYYYFYYCCYNNNNFFIIFIMILIYIIII